jgi:hypothetical protein
MILEEDVNKTYNKQLTKGVDKPARLEFAVKMFRNDISTHCIVKAEKVNGHEQFAVYVLGGK